MMGNGNEIPFQVQNSLANFYFLNSTWFLPWRGYLQRVLKQTFSRRGVRGVETSAFGWLSEKL